MTEQINSQNVFAICKTLPVEEKAKLVKQLLGDLSLLSYFITFFDTEQIAAILQAIAVHIARKT